MAPGASSPLGSLAAACVIVFCAAVIVSLTLVPIFRLIALRLNIVDHPGARKIHLHAKPYLGGAAIYLSFMGVVLPGVAALWLFHDSALLKDLSPWLAQQIAGVRSTLWQLLAILCGASIAFAIGLWDDVTSSPHTFHIKVLAQLGAAILAVSAGVSIDFFGSPIVNIPLSILWIVGIMNAFNLLDNMDGLSGGIALIALLIFSAVALMLGQHYVAMINLALAGSVLGFLRYNFYPSQIFMGDAGSLFIGYMLGTLTVLESYVDGTGVTAFSAIMPLIILSVPLADTASVIIIRIRNGKPIYIGDRNHLSHRLVSMGLSQRGAVLLLYGVGSLMGLSAILLPSLSLLQGGLLVLQSLMVVGVVTSLIFYGNRGRMRPGELEQLQERAELERTHPSKKVRSAANLP